MTPSEKLLFISSLSALVSQSETAAPFFYKRLFALDPSLRPLFKGSIKEQGRKFMLMLEAISDSLDQIDSIVPLLWQMGKRHGGYGVTVAHYDTVADALFQTLEEHLGDRFTPEVRAVWTELYALIAATMLQAAEEGIVPRAT